MIEERGLGLAATKLHAPAPPRQLVRRSRLDEILDAGLDRGAALVLVSAPAGSGKSTLVASWSAGRTASVAWLQVEDQDSDPARFWSFVVDALGQIDSVDVAGVKALVVGSNGDADVVVPALVNVLVAVDRPLVVVIDDYHLIDNDDIHRGMERLVDLCPRQVTIVLSTRYDPPFRLGRLRVRQQIVEVRDADLRFATGEASGLLGTVGPTLDLDQLDRLCGRTEGWAAGLVLAGLSLQRSADPAEFIDAFRGDDQLVVEYLRDEFLAATGDDDRRRLLETAILEQITGGLVDAVTATTGGAQWMRETAAVNQLVVGLDRTGTWFRYHHLLRDLLRLEAQQTFPDRLPELHARAATWFESQGDLGQAITHRLAGGDPRHAAALLRVHGPRLLADGQIDTLRGFLEQLGDVAKTVTWCALLYAWCEFIGGRYASSDQWIDVLLDIAPDGFDQVMAVPLRINNSLARGDVTPALDLARQMTRTDQLLAHSSDLSTATGAAYAWAGQADDARRTLRLAVEKGAVEGIRTAHVLALVYQAVVELDDGSRQSARAAASLALDTATGFGLAEYHGVAPAYAIRARTAPDEADARTDAAHAVNLARRVSTDLAFGLVLTACGDTLIDLGDPTGAALLVEARSVLGRCPDPGIVGRHLDRAESRHGIADASRDRVDVLVEQLTERELAVLRHLPTGMTQREIASELYVSINTVKTHSHAIYRKLGVDNRRAAVQAARDLHLL